MDRVGEFLTLIFFSIVVPVQYFLLVVIGVVVMDTILGVASVKKRNDKYNFKRLTGSFLAKVLIFQMLILCGYWVDYLLINEVILKIVDIEMLSLKFLTSILLIKEFRSIFKHFNLIFDRKLEDEVKDAYDLGKDVKDKVKDFFK